MLPKAAVAFTGGKDSILALHLVSVHYQTFLGDSYLQVDPLILVSFQPTSTTEFKAHHQQWTSMQAASLGIQLVTKQIDAQPSFEQNYRKAIAELHDEHGITRLVTGDIEDVGEGFMDRVCVGTNVELLRPLWKLPRTQVLGMLRQLEIKYVVTLTRLDKLPRPLSERLLGNYCPLEYLLEQFKWYEEEFGDRIEVDLAGEYGEMHTMVTECPLFTRPADIKSGRKLVYETQFGAYMYLEIL